MNIASGGRQTDIDDLRRSLRELALDLRYPAKGASVAMWQALDPELWARTENRWLVLQSASDLRLCELAADDGFMSIFDIEMARHVKRLDGASWFDRENKLTPPPVCAYFSMEFMLAESLPIYSGGLGNVAGDQLKAASDLGVPVIGIGLLYQQGYPRQLIDDDGKQREAHPYNDPSQLPISPTRDAQGRWLRVSIPFAGSPVAAKVWEVAVGRNRLYLLDVNTPWNRPDVRGTTSELYGGDDELRLSQEIVLGIGGVRLLDALGIEPDVFHLNEGHAAFAVIERAVTLARRTDLSFWEAMEITRAGTLFTTHTPVSAAFDSFPRWLVARYLGQYLSDEVGVDIDDVIRMGQNGDHDHVNMAYLALRGSGAVNGVSELHGEVSRKLFSPLFPRWPVAEVPIGHVTNGIHVPTWKSPEVEEVTHDLTSRGSRVHALVDRLESLSDGQLWEMRTKARRRLVDYVRERASMRLGDMGLRESEQAGHRLFDPNALTIGFARRFATYKRPNLMLSDPERVVAMLTDIDRPVQIVVAGKAHPRDHAGQEMVREWVQFSRRVEVERSVIFLADYDMSMSRHLVRGVDLWLNNPRRPWEASGTSGMKVLVNGGLNLSVADGWWAEAYQPGLGWVIDSDESSDEADDKVAAESMFRVLEEEVIPTFYERDIHGVPVAWVQMVRNSIADLTLQYSSERTVQEYASSYYLPLAQSYRERLAGDAAVARKLYAWTGRVRREWPSVRLAAPILESDLRTRTVVYLGGLTPADVRVELFAEPAIEGAAATVIPMTASERLIGADGGYRYEADLPDARPVSDYSARAFPSHPSLRQPLEVPLIAWSASGGYIGHVDPLGGVEGVDGSPR